MTNIIRLSRNAGTNQHVGISWREEDGTYICSRTMPGLNETARIPALDTDELLEVMKFMRDFLAGTIDEEFITPDL